MRTVLNGSGADTTAAVKAYLAAGNQFRLADLYLIGDYDDPQAVRFTSWPYALDYPIWGTFLPASVSRGTIESKIGLEVADLEITWTPILGAPTSSIETANPYQLAQLGFFDNKLVRVWTAFMPTPGDANTYGCAAMFGGRIGQCQIERGKIVFTVNSFLDVVNEMVPTNTIELTMTSAGYAGAVPPLGFSAIPQFAVIAGSTNTVIIGDETGPNAHHIYGENIFIGGGFLVFNGGSGSTLARVLSRIASNKLYTVGGHNYNQFTLYDPLPWAPTPGMDTFYVSGPAPINSQSLGSATLTSGGTGYSLDDVLTLQAGGFNATLQVTAVDGGGGITEYQLINGGSGYQPASGVTVVGGTGSGAVFTIALPDATQGFPYVPSPEQAL